MALFSYLNIADARERALVGTFDATVALGTRLLGARRPLPPPASITRVVVLRLERIGDLVMSLDALADLRAALPSAQITLVVGRWNLELASMIRSVDEVVEISLPWIARHEGRDSWLSAATKARALSSRKWDLGVNLEPDVRSNILLRLTGARHRLGFSSGGGGDLLTHANAYDITRHTSWNARHLVSPLVPPSQRPDTSVPTPLVITPDMRRRVAEILRESGVPSGMPLIAVHVSGGRPVKQWPPERFGEAAGAWAQSSGAFVVFTGADGDRGLVEFAMAALPGGVHAANLVGRLGLSDLAALYTTCSLVLTGDTGPMHLAAAVNAPIVSVFGPSSPVRYAPTHATSKVVRVELPCSPCNRIRQPPRRCQGHTPDCLAGVETTAVINAGHELWRETDALARPKGEDS